MIEDPSVSKEDLVPILEMYDDQVRKLQTELEKMSWKGHTESAVQNKVVKKALDTEEHTRGDLNDALALSPPTPPPRGRSAAPTKSTTCELA